MRGDAAGESLGSERRNAMTLASNHPSRRALIRGAGLAIGAGALVQPAAATAAPETIWSAEYWVRKGEVRLFIYRKRVGNDPRPVLFLVHGSSFGCKSSYDLTVPGRTDYSLMDKLATLGFDVWTMDHEGYGRSSRTQSNSDIASGVEDLKAASEVVDRDMPGTSEPIVAEALADAEAKYGTTVPTGTYLDMATKLPLVDPAKLSCPVQIIRAEFDGIATEDDLFAFYRALPNKEKQFVFLSGSAHVSAFGVNRHRFWHAMNEF